MFRNFFSRFQRWRVLAAVALSIAAAGLARAAADPEPRVALVIGNGNYRAAPVLPNPVGDAKAIAASFRRLGFDVTDGYDLTIEEMRKVIASFAAKLPDAHAALIYYAGHGISVDGENYLLPTDIVLKSPTDLDLQAIEMSLLLRQLKREERANVVIMDACRDNPFAGDLSHAATRAVVGSRGLSPVESNLAKGTLIAYASDPNSTALDGKPGENSPFTKALLSHLEDPDVSIDTVMSRVRSDVWEATNNKQMPWVDTSLIGELVLNRSTAAVAAGSAAQPSAAAPVAGDTDRFALQNRFWDSAEHGNAIEDYQAYLDAYPNGLYAAMARSRIARLTPPASSAVEDAHARDTAEPAPPAPPADAALHNEVGTQDSETALKLDQAQRREVQARLTALAFDVGPVNGELGFKTRNAIIGWQKNHGIQATGWLGPVQYAALKTETEGSYQQFLLAPPAETPKPRHEAQKRSLSPPAAVVDRKPRVQPHPAPVATRQRAPAANDRATTRTDDGQPRNPPPYVQQRVPVVVGVGPVRPYYYHPPYLYHPPYYPPPYGPHPPPYGPHPPPIGVGIGVIGGMVGGLINQYGH